MKIKKDGWIKYWFLGLGCAFLIFVWGFISWITARQYIPVTPKPGPPNRFSLTKKSIAHPIAKYKDLLSGKLFFGQGVMINSQGTFQTKLILWGLIHGSRAIVGTDPQSNQTTWIVQSGDSIEGEKIVTVGDNYIIIHNQTGEGKVYLR